jgi:hypothetical protein
MDHHDCVVLFLSNGPPCKLLGLLRGSWWSKWEPYQNSRCVSFQIQHVIYLMKLKFLFLFVFVFVILFIYFKLVFWETLKDTQFILETGLPKKLHFVYPVFYFRMFCLLWKVNKQLNTIFITFIIYYLVFILFEKSILVLPLFYLGLN